ncbi:hypothetical protein FRB96_006023 [Tulasnella sp. 330]|nr:hypothetical protein FRB96_006023 [Tulasnella sp. 330]KAG8876813.1 hypothetical protein FRB97_003904 [Tulasnella sp. 331]KAG8882051.1 hypothetical protein FRB98_003940 [Tulasnella sp. 332]
MADSFKTTVHVNGHAFNFLTHLPTLFSSSPVKGRNSGQKTMAASASSATVTYPNPKGISGLVANASHVVSTLVNSTPACEGWLLKKRRKKMQGYAKRYFILSSLGLLSYSASPGGPVRDQMSLRLASISSSAEESSRSIHIDSGMDTFHLKALNPNDYTQWMTALRRFCTFASNPANWDDPLLSPHRRASLSMSRTITMTGSLHAGQTAGSRALHAAHDLGTTIKEIEDALQTLAASPEFEKIDKKSHAIKARKEKERAKDKDRDKDKDKDREKDKEHHHKFTLFHRRSEQKTAPSQRSTGSDGEASILAGSNSYNGTATGAASGTPPATPSHFSHEDSFDSVRSAPPLTPTPASASQSTSTATISAATTPIKLFVKLHTSVATLRAQHNALLNLLDSSLSHPASAAASMKSPLSRVNEIIAQHQSPHSPRPSIGTIDSVWYDAEEGAEEFILSSEPASGLTMRNFESSTTVHEEDIGTEDGEGVTDDDDDGSADDVDTMLVTSNDSTPKEATSNSVRFQVENKLPKVIVRRTRLPAPTSGDDGSLLAVLRKNVGKDLSTVSFPVSFNEPISILQRLAEDVEYTGLLDQAVTTTDPVQRLCLIASFAVSGYACTLYRASRKPFNPMLGETFEDVRMNFVSEKVSHHPAIMACHASGTGWEYWSTSSADSKFWGRSLEIINKGTTHVKIGESHYKWQGMFHESQKPSSFMRNLIVGEKYLTHEGEMIITDANTGYQCVLTFKEGGYFGGSRSVNGVVSDPRSPKQILARIDGTWNEGISLQLDPKGSHLKVLWRAKSFPPHAQQYYGFTEFTMSLNEMTEDLLEPGRLPPTDCRFRPDQRAMEEGNIDFADEEKERLEVAQRARRKARDESGDVWVPKWFERSKGLDTSDEWVYKGGYWEAREKKNWDGCPKLW